MNSWNRTAVAWFTLAALTATAGANPGATAETDPFASPMPDATEGEADDAGAEAEAEAAEEEETEEPGRGDFDAGGEVRLPSGPDEMGEYETFNWVTLDLGGRYFILDWLTVNAAMPLAVKKPGSIMVDPMTEIDPKAFGGFSVSLEAILPKLPFQSEKYETKVGVLLESTFMREGAVLLSERDYPLYAGDVKPGVTTGLIAKIKLSSLVDFSMTPVFAYQSASNGSITAVQIPTSTILRLGSLVKVSADLGIFTGDDFSFKGDEGGRVSAGASLTVKIGPVLAHAGAGVASLQTGGLYPSIGDSVYIDLNVKYAK